MQIFPKFTIMINNYIKTTLRNIQKHRILSVINILGLTIGLSAMILIGIYVRHEISFDRFHKHAENIYRIERKGVFDGNEFHLPHTNNLIPPAMQDEFPPVVNFVRIWPREVMLQDSRKNYHQEEIYFADASFFDMFSFPLVEGDPSDVLTRPYSAVLSREMAEKYFGNTDAVGQTMEVQAFDSTITLTVQGLMENMPENSHLQSGMIVSYKTAQSLTPPSLLNTWVGNYLYSYIRVKEGTDLNQLTAQLPSFIKKYMSADFKRMLGDDVQVSKMLHFHLQPLTDIYLYARLDYAIGPTGDINKIYTAVGIALLILIIACINYINLSTAKSMTRAREVGLRKVFGAHRRKVILQFISESVVLAIIALLLSMIVVESLLPWFNSFLLKELSIGYLRRPEILFILLGSAVLIGTLAGIYPALYISSYRPISILKGTDHSPTGSASGNIRKGLVIFQFAISIGLLISVFTMNRQLMYMIQKDLGFEEEQVMVVRSDNHTFRDNMQTIRQELMGHPEIQNVGLANRIVGEEEYGDGVFRRKDDPKENTENFTILHIGENLIPSLNIELLAGRNFSSDYGSDRHSSYIINESAMKMLGYQDPREAVGSRLIEMNLDSQGEGQIVGVVRDFHYQPLHIRIKPLIFIFREQGLNNMYVKLDGQHTKQSISLVQSVIDQNAPGINFHYTFLDNHYRNSYRKEMRMKKLFTIFTILAIFIASMGLFGLAAFMTERKTKEIGIRKAIGASTSRIIVILSSQFLKWVLIANLIAWPVVYFALNKWLQNFAFHIEQNVVYFLLASIIALAVAQLTIFYQAFTAARTNPVESLRYE